MREVIELTCVNGEIVNVSPLPPMLQRELNAKVNEKYPPVDKALYETVDPNAFVAGEKLPAENNPAYIQAVKTHTRRVNDYLQELFIETCVRVPLVPANSGSIVTLTKENVIAAWKAQIDEYKSVMDTSVSDYALAIQFGYLTTDEDMVSMLLAARKDLPLTQEEVIDGVKFFRNQVQRRTPRGSLKNTRTQSIQTQNGTADHHREPAL